MSWKVCRRRNEELNRNFLHPRGLQLTQVYDETEYINSAVDLVRQNILIGGALTMIVLMMFLHLNARTLVTIPFAMATALAAAYVSSWYYVACLIILLGVGFWFARGALVVAMAIPTSIVGTFLVLGLLGRSLNVISLAGMAFAVGMLVDNAVVVLENIYRRHSLGESPFTAATRGTQEVWGAVLASTLTTVAVFLPVVFVQEEAGQLFRDIALAIAAAVSLSLIVSVTLIPMLTARLFGTRGSTPARAGAIASIGGNGNHIESALRPRDGDGSSTHVSRTASRMAPAAQGSCVGSRCWAAVLCRRSWRPTDGCNGVLSAGWHWC